MEKMVEEVEYIYMNGKFVPWKEANIHILTHCLHYGSGVFEGIRCYETEKGPAIFRLKKHMDRLYNSAKAVYLEIPISQEEFTEAVVELIKKNNIKSCYIRPIVYNGYGVMGLDNRESPVNFSIIVWPWGTYLGKEALASGTKITLAEHTRRHDIFAGAKICGFYYNSIVTKRGALAKGYQEALLLDDKGFVSEGSAENVFIIKDNVLKTPKEGAILKGITRDSIIQIAKDEGLKVEEEDLTLDDFQNADEAFFTGTAAEVTPIQSLDDKQIGNRIFQITKKLQKIYFDTVNGRNEKYKDWLTLINK